MFMLVYTYCMVCISRLLFFVLQFIATYFGGGIIITISFHTYNCVTFNKYTQTLKHTFHSKRTITISSFIEYKPF